MKIASTIPSLIPSTQSNKVLKKLLKKKEEGAYRSESEYQEDLRKQLIDIAKRDGSNIFSYRAIQPGKAYAEYVNNSMEEIETDLSVVFTELGFLFSKIRSHEVFFERTIKEIQNLLIKLEKKLEATEIEASLDTIYNKVIHDSFLDKSNMMALINPKANELYYDKKLDLKTRSEDLAEVNSNIGELSISKYSEDEIKIAEINIVSTETTVSPYNIQLPGSSTEKLLSEKPSDTWSYQILTKKKIPGGAKLVLEIDLGDKQEINSFFISPNSSAPVYFNSLSYENESGDDVILSTDIGSLVSDKLISFPTIIARRLKISLSQDKVKSIPLDPSDETTSLEDLQRDSSLNISISTISDQVSEQINDPNIQNILGLNQNKISNYLLLNQYTFSLNSIKVGVSDYKTKGDFVSKAISTKPLSLIGLEVEEIINTTVDVQTNMEMPFGATEYTIVKKDFIDNELVKSSEFNILPIGQTLINNEYLPFGKNKIQTLRFLGHQENGNGSEIKIFRNGEELIRGMDWAFEDRVNNLDLSDSIVNPEATSTKITILHSDVQITNGIYYAVYSPRYTLMDSSQDHGIQYLSSGVTKHPITYLGQSIDYSNIYLKIILRNLTNKGVSSPIVGYYRLLMKEESDDE